MSKPPNPEMVVYVTEAEWSDVVLPACREAFAKNDADIAHRAVSQVIGEEHAARIAGRVYGVRIIEDLLRRRVEKATADNSASIDLKRER